MQVLLTFDVTFQLDSGMRAFAADWEVGLKLLRGLEEIYFSLLSSAPAGFTV